MKFLPRFFFSGLGAAALAGMLFASNFAAARPALDRALLSLLPALALGYLLFDFLRAAGRFTLPSFSSFQLRVFLAENAPGIALAFAAWAVYLFLALRLNFPQNDTTDNFLDADNYPWMLRIAAPNGYRQEMRAPHPFAFFLLRPLGLGLNFLTHNPFLSAVLLNTLAGALGVFLLWLFVKRASANRAYALLFAALFAVSASHLFFSAVIETYIFSALAMLAFFLLLQTGKTDSALVAAGVATFGITFTNLAQELIGVFVTRFKNLASLQSMARLTARILSISVLISVLHAVAYPSSRLFFLPADVQREGEFSYSILDEPAWRASGRIQLLTRTLLLYAVIAPVEPYISLHEKNEDFPRFNFFKIEPGTFSLSAYHGLGNALAAVWALILLAAGGLFLWQMARRRDVRFALAFGLTLLFNFLLHINYGFELFLYSPDWAYALILFVALAFLPLAEKRFLHVGLLLFLFALAYNQAQFFQFIFNAIAPYLPVSG